MLLLLLALLSPMAYAGGGDYCVIPVLYQGRSTVVDVPDISKPFCGTAIIGNHYVRMSDVAKATDESDPKCTTETLCTKVLRFYADEAKATPPYTLILMGPRHGKAASSG